MDRLMERAPDMVLVLLIGSSLMTLACIVLLVAAQRAGIRRSAPWPSWAGVATFLGVLWVLIR